MSLTELLADYPKYSARKVRKLAHQLRFLQGAEDQATARGIAADLMEHHMRSAMTEAQMNDDVQETGTGVFRENLERVYVVPVEYARRAVDHIVAFVETLNGQSPVVKTAHGIINGSTFCTDRKVIEEET